MEKYLLELADEQNHKAIERLYFDSVDKILKYLVDNKKTIFNWGFSSKEIHLYRVKKGE